MRELFKKPEVYADSLYNLEAFLDECYGLLPIGTYRLKRKIRKHLQNEADYIPFRADIGSAIIIVKNHGEINELLYYIHQRKRR